MTTEIITLKVGGMTCGHCAKTVERRVREASGVEDAKVDLASGTLTARLRVGAPRAGVAAAVLAAGYEVEG